MGDTPSSELGTYRGFALTLIVSYEQRLFIQMSGEGKTDIVAANVGSGSPEKAKSDALLAALQRAKERIDLFIRRETERKNHVALLRETVASWQDPDRPPSEE